MLFCFAFAIALFDWPLFHVHFECIEWSFGGEDCGIKGRRAFLSFSGIDEFILHIFKQNNNEKREEKKKHRIAFNEIK